MPAELRDEVAARRADLVEAVAGADDVIADLFLGEEAVSGEVLQAAIRRCGRARGGRVRGSHAARLNVPAAAALG